MSGWTRDDLAKGLAALDGQAWFCVRQADYLRRADDLLAHLSVGSTSSAEADPTDDVDRENWLRLKVLERIETVRSLPPVPSPDIRCCVSAFTAGQMEAYALNAVLSDRARRHIVDSES